MVCQPKELSARSPTEKEFEGNVSLLVFNLQGKAAQGRRGRNLRF